MLSLIDYGFFYVIPPFFSYCFARHIDAGPMVTVYTAHEAPTKRSFCIRMAMPAIFLFCVLYLYQMQFFAVVVVVGDHLCFLNFAYCARLRSHDNYYYYYRQQRTHEIQVEKNKQKYFRNTRAMLVTTKRTARIYTYEEFSLRISDRKREKKPLSDICVFPRVFRRIINTHNTLQILQRQ